MKKTDDKTILVGLKPAPLHDKLLFDLGAHHSVKVVSNGVELVRLIPEVCPSLIILESDLPGLSGFQVAQFVKGHPHLNVVPVLIIISQGYQIGQFWAKEVGVDYCEPEPGYDPVKLTKVALELVRRSLADSISENDWLKLRNEIHGDNVLASLSEILDEHLLESTIANHIAYLAQGSQDLNDLLKSVMLLLRDILEYDAGAVHLFKQNVIYTITEQGKPDDVREAFISEVIEYGEVYRVAAPLEEEIIPVEIPLGTFQSVNHDESRSPTIFTIPLDARQSILGTLTLETFKSAVKRDYFLRMLDLVAKQIALVLDNALLYQEVLRLSIIDELTGLPNRRAFYHLFETELVRSIRYVQPLSIAILDIDFFKKVNDTYGHLQGDNILSECARIFASSVREKIDTVARFGGEEFIILLPQTDIEGSRVVMERLRNAVEQHPFKLLGLDETICITVSVGLASIKGNVTHKIDEIIHQADTALYAAKESGRNNVMIAPDLD